MVHAIELKPGKGAQLVRCAGAAAQLMAKEGNYATLRLPSGEFRMVHLECRATVGQVGNVEHENIIIGKAGRMRWLGRRPHTRGVVHEPGGPPPRRRRGQGAHRPAGAGDPVGQADALGNRTRKKNKKSDAYIVRGGGARARPAWRRMWLWAGPSKKGPYAHPSLLKKVREMNETGEKRVIKTWSRDVDHLSRDGRATPSRSTTGGKHVPDLHHRGHGRPQAGRVRADADVPGSRRHRRSGRPVADSGRGRKDDGGQSQLPDTYGFRPARRGR